MFFIRNDISPKAVSRDDRSIEAFIESSILERKNGY